MRKDLEELVAHARSEGLYSTLVTSGLGLTRNRAQSLKEAGIDHVQISFQDSDTQSAEQIAGIRSVKQKRAAAELVRELDLAFSVNVVLHRQNLDHLSDIIEMAASMGADRLELANTQYYGWALKNRAALLPTRQQVEASKAIAEAAIKKYRGRCRSSMCCPTITRPTRRPATAGGAMCTSW